MDYALKAIEQCLGSNPTLATADSGKTAKYYDNIRLYLERCALTGRLKGRVVVLHPSSITVQEETIADLNRSLDAFDRPPEIMMEEKPTELETAELFRLCEEQILCFRILNRTLQAEKAGRRVDQLRMVIMGQAGTGKSEILSAILWHSYQHEMNRLIGASAYQWKPALLLRTENTQAVSCCSFYGVDKFHPDTQGKPLLSKIYFKYVYFCPLRFRDSTV